MAINSLKSLHENDWKNVKTDYETLKNDSDIAERMELLISFYKHLKPKKTLDIGCGSGYMGHLIKKFDPDVVIHGLDVSEHAISQIKDYDKAYFLNIDENNIPEPDNDFDLVVCSDVIEHIYDVDHCLNEIKRILKPGAKAIITTPNYSFWKYRVITLLGGMPSILKDPRHIHVFNLDVIRRKCYSMGLDIAYSIKGRKDFITKHCEKLFNKTTITILTKK